jgi:hypothetical protein
MGWSRSLENRESANDARNVIAVIARILQIREWASTFHSLAYTRPPSYCYLQIPRAQFQLPKALRGMMFRSFLS